MVIDGGYRQRAVQVRWPASRPVSGGRRSLELCRRRLPTVYVVRLSCVGPVHVVRLSCVCRRRVARRWWSVGAATTMTARRRHGSRDVAKFYRRRPSTQARAGRREDQRRRRGPGGGGCFRRHVGHHVSAAAAAAAGEGRHDVASDERPATLAALSARPPQRPRAEDAVDERIERAVREREQLGGRQQAR